MEGGVEGGEGEERRGEERRGEERRGEEGEEERKGRRGRGERGWGEKKEGAIIVKFLMKVKQYKCSYHNSLFLARWSVLCWILRIRL